MNYWKYKHVLISLDEHNMETKVVTETLDSLGEDGWELVSASSDGDYYDLFFKKPDFARELEFRMEQMRLRYQAKQEATELMRDLEQPHADQ